MSIYSSGITKLNIGEKVYMIFLLFFTFSKNSLKLLISFSLYNLIIFSVNVIFFPVLNSENLTEAIIS